MPLRWKAALPYAFGHALNDDRTPPLSDGAGDGRPEPNLRGARRRRRWIEFGLLGRRAAAAAIDFLCVAIAASLVTAAFVGAYSEQAALVFTLSLAVAWLAYDTAIVGAGQATLGQRAMDIELVSIDDAPVGRLQAAIWSFVFLVGVVVSGGMVLLFPLVDASGRGANDVLAAVRVRRRKPASARIALAERIS